MEKFRAFFEKNYRYLLVLLFVTFGFGLFYGLGSSGQYMRDIADSYLTKFKLEDIQLATTHGIDQEELNIIEEVANPEYISIGYELDVAIPEVNKLISLESMPESWVKHELIEGAYPVKAGEIAIDANSKDFPYEIGDEMELFPKGANLTHDLKQRKFKVVGKISSPEYILSAEKGKSPSTGALVDGYGLIVKEDFEITHPNFLRIHLKEANTGSVFSARYKNVLENTNTKLKEAFSDMPEKKASKVKAQAEEAIKKSTVLIAELTDLYKNYDQDLEKRAGVIEKDKAAFDEAKAAFEEKLAKSKDDLETGDERIAKNKETAAGLKKDLEEYKGQVGEKENNVYYFRSKVDEIRGVVDGKRIELENEQSLLDSEKDSIYKKIGANEGEISSHNSAIRSLNVRRVLLPRERGAIDGEIEDHENSIGNLEDEISSLEDRLEELSGWQSTIDAGYDEIGPELAELENLEGQLAGAEGALYNLNNSIYAAEEGINEAEANVETIGKDMVAAKKFLEEGEKEEREAGLKEQEEALTKLKDELKDRTENKEENLINIESEISRNENVVKRSEEELKIGTLPMYNFIATSENQGFKLYNNISKRVDMMTRLVPVILLIISLALGSREMFINEEEGAEDEISPLKKNLLASGLAVILGSIIGFFGLSWSVFRIYRESVNINQRIFAIYPVYLLIGLVLVLASIFAVNHIYKKKDQLREKLVKYRTYIIGLIGVSLASAVVVTGLLLAQNLDIIPKIQYSDILKYDARLYLREGVQADKATELDYFIKEVKNARDTQDLHESAYVSESGIDFRIVVPKTPEGFQEKSIILNNAEDEGNLVLGEMVLMSSSLADQLGLAPGGEFSFKAEDGSIKTSVVDGIFRSYVDNLVLMPQPSYVKIFAKDPVYNQRFVQLKDNSTYAMETFADEAYDFEQVEGVVTKAGEMEETRKLLKPLSFISYVYIGGAALALTVAIAYINAVFKEPAILFDFQRKLGKWSSLVVTTVLTLLGCLLGTAIYFYMTKLKVADNIKFPFIISALNYLWVLGAVLIVGWMAKLSRRESIKIEK